MFAEVKSMLPVSGDAYDGEIAMQIKAAALDLTRTAEIILPGEIDISIETRQYKDDQGNPMLDEDTGEPMTYKVVVDNSTIEDEYLIAAIACWCTAMIGNPPNYNNMLKAYEAMKGNMRLSREYTDYGGAC